MHKIHTMFSFCTVLAPEEFVFGMNPNSA